MRILLLLCISILLLAPDSGRSQIILIDRLQDAVSIDATARHLFILEKGKNRFLKLDFDGLLIDSLGNRGSGDYEFDDPVDIDVSNGLRIYVSDAGNNRIQVYDRRFQYLSSLPVRNPGAIHVTPFNEVLVFNKNTNNILLFDEFGQERPRFNMPAEIKTVKRIKAGDSRLYILDPKTKVVHELERNGLYRSFFPAAEVKAISMRQNQLYLATDIHIISAQSGEIVKRLSLSEVRDVVYVAGRGWYVLTERSLLFYED